MTQSENATNNLFTQRACRRLPVKHYAAVIEVWAQCSSDYQAAHRTEVIELDPTTTIADLMEHVADWNLLGMGDIRIVEATQDVGKDAT